MRTILLLLICIYEALPGYVLPGKEPLWVANSGKTVEFPDSLYLTGFGMSMETGGLTVQQCADAAVENAKKNLVEKIRIKIVSVTSTKSEESAEKYSSFFSSAVQSTSSLDVDGLSFERYADDDVHYAFVYIKRKEIIASYNSKVHKYRNDLEAKFTLAQKLEHQNRKQLALKEYISCYPVIQQLEEAQSIYSSLQLYHSINELLNDAATNEITSQKIREAVLRLTDRPLESIEDLAAYIVSVLFDQLRTEELPINVLPITFEDTQIGSSFSRYFTSLIEQKCNEIAQWNVVVTQFDAVLSGTYWDNGNDVKFVMSLREAGSGTIIGGAEISLNKSLLRAVGKEWKPANFQQALADQKIFISDERSDGGLAVQGWTNKSSKGNLFVDGERMRVTLKVNMPCYIRLVYHMADGRRILLLNETYIDESKVNVPYTLPNEFECSAPFGSEVLQIFARTDRFEQVRTQNIDGYLVLKEDLNVFITKTRGMKAAKPTTLQSEYRLGITTMKQ